MTNDRSSNKILTDDERQVLQDICDDVGIPCPIVEQMIVAEHRVYGMGRRHGIWEALEPLITKGLAGSSRSKESPQ